jgi:hypothetical protein
MTARMQTMAVRVRVSKSSYIAGLQCRKLLWWRVHDPVEIADDATEVLLERGRLVGEAARKFLPGGVLINPPQYSITERVAATQRSIASGARLIYEASFATDDVFVSVDILERRARGWTLIEVKDALDVKEQHIPDVAVQLHVLQRAGIDVERVEVMHLNRECTHPDLSNLFVRENVTTEAQKVARSAPRLIREFAEVLRGKLPKVEVGAHCDSPYACAFKDRCWPEPPSHHLSTIYRINRDVLAKLIDAGHETIHDLPKDFKAGPTAARQIKSIRRRRLIVEDGLGEALSAIKGPIAFLDFETIYPAIPAWTGCRPYMQIPVQLSCHVQTPRGFRRHEWLADGSEDPRPAFARELETACAGAATILAYGAPFEKARIEDLWEALPSLEPQLSSIHGRIQDLLPIVRKHVYHPNFNGSFSLKSVLPALLPDMGYGDLEIQDGGTAAAALEMLLFDEAMPTADKKALRKQLLAYCERDTLAMVKLHERLGRLAEGREV